MLQADVAVKKARLHRPASGFCTKATSSRTARSQGEQLADVVAVICRSHFKGMRSVAPNQRKQVSMPEPFGELQVR